MMVGKIRILKSFPAAFEVLHWHHDMPGIPHGAALLAHSTGCPHQAFRFADHVYGFQFHMEPTENSIKPLLENAVNDLTPSKFTQTPEDILAFNFETMNQRLRYILDSIAKLTGE